MFLRPDARLGQYDGDDIAVLEGILAYHILSLTRKKVKSSTINKNNEKLVEFSFILL